VKSAEQEALRVQRLEDAKAVRVERNATMSDQADINRRENARIKKEAIREKEERDAQALTEQQKRNIRILNPEKAKADDVEIFRTLEKVKDPATKAAINATDDQLPLLAAGNNG